MKTKKQKIGIVVPSLHIGGNKRSAVNIAKMLSNYYEVYLILFDTRNKMIYYTGEILDMRSPAKNNNISRIFHSFSRLYKLKKIIKSKQLDAIYLILGPKNILNYASYGKCKKIISARDFSSLSKNAKLFKKQLNKSNMMISNSNLQAEYYKNLYPEDVNKIKVIYNTVDINMIKKLAQEPIEKEVSDFLEDNKTIISVGRFAKEKGFIHLIKSFEVLREKTNNVRLLLIGDGELFDYMYNIVKNSKYSKSILLLGARKNPFKYLSKCDVFALTSINEGFPNVVLEAMACGLPIVSTNCKSGPSEILNDKWDNNNKIENLYFGDYGILVPVFKTHNFKSIEKEHYIFANALSAILTDYNLKIRYSNSSLKRAKDFSLESNAIEYYKVFSNLFNKE